MYRFECVINDPLGLHARPIGQIARAVLPYRSDITIERDGQSVDIRRMVAIMGLGVECGETVAVCVSGPDEETAGPVVEAAFREVF